MVWCVSASPTLFFLLLTMLSRHHNYPLISAAAKAATSATFVQDASSTFAFAGDVALALDRNVAGTIMFAFAHLLNIATWLREWQDCASLLLTWQSVAVKLVLGLAAFVALQTKSVPNGWLYRAYVTVLLTATHIAIVTQSATRGVGMVLFVVADIGVGIELSGDEERNDGRKKIHKTTWQWALPMYYLAQWLMIVDDS
jgi:hypothetical protein